MEGNQEAVFSLHRGGAKLVLLVVYQYSGVLWAELEDGDVALVIGLAEQIGVLDVAVLVFQKTSGGKGTECDIGFISPHMHRETYSINLDMHTCDPRASSKQANKKGEKTTKIGPLEPVLKRKQT
jgi:hypothetical protein